MRWTPVVSAVLLFGVASRAQTSWISATFDGVVASWVFSVTPSATSAATAAFTTPSTTSPINSATASSSSRTRQSSPSLIPSDTISAATTSSKTRDSTLVTSTSRSASSLAPSSAPSSIPSTTVSSSSITPSSFVASSAAGITLSQAAAPLPSSTSTADSASGTSSGSNSNTLLKIILSVVISILAVLVLAIILFLCLRRRKRKNAQTAPALPPHDQEKNWPETAYMPHSQPTLPILRTPHASRPQLYMPAPTAAPEILHTRQDSLYEPSPLETAGNPFLASAERLGAPSLPGSARGSYQPLTSHSAQAGSSAKAHRDIAGMVELPAGAFDRPLMPHDTSSNEASTDYTDSRPSSDGFSHGDLGLLTHHDHYQDIPAAQSGETRYPAAARPSSATIKSSPHPPSVLASHTTPQRNSRRSPAFYQPSHEKQSFDFGFGRSDSGIAGPVTGYRKSPNTSIHERLPMVSADSSTEDFDEAGTGGMVPLGYSPDTIPTHTGGGRGSLRRESLNDRLGSLRRAASVRRSSLRGGSDKGSPSGRFSIPRRPIGTL